MTKKQKDGMRSCPTDTMPRKSNKEIAKAAIQAAIKATANGKAKPTIVKKPTVTATATATAAAAIGKVSVNATLPKKRRTHHRTTTLTTTCETFKTLSKIAVGVKMDVTFPNDIISSSRGAIDNIHHSIRRVDLLRRQFRLGFNRIKVRVEQGDEINCILVGNIRGETDSCVGRATVMRSA